MNELTRLAYHVREEQERRPRRDAIREDLLRQIRRSGSVIVTRHFLAEAFSQPDQTENFFLAIGGCRPVPSLMAQIEQWCATNDLELRQRPNDEVLLLSRTFFEPTKLQG